jgi:hypothetical protein
MRKREDAVKFSIEISVKKTSFKTQFIKTLESRSITVFINQWNG